MTTRTTTITAALLLATAPLTGAQTDPPESRTSFADAAARVLADLEASTAELAALRDRIAEEKLPLQETLSELEMERSEVRQEYLQTTRQLDSQSLDLTNLRSEIAKGQRDVDYLSSLLADYARNFETSLHVAEKQRYGDAVASARLAMENTTLSDGDVFAAQIALVEASLDRLEGALGGARFGGTAVDADGLVQQGTFVVVGPAGLFRSSDGKVVGTTATRVGSDEPASVRYGDPEHAAAAEELIAAGAGTFPLDPTLGNALKYQATQEPFWEHVKKGGPVMVPIFALAAAALLVALWKWLSLAFLRKPSGRSIRALLDAVGKGDLEGAAQRARAMPGPIGRMLTVGVDHASEPRDLIEEAMYETVLTTRLGAQRFLPFIAVAAASAPLLGLLGTVTGIINTFKVITVFGSADVANLSGGISEALVTTKFGLIVAIPSLLLHAFLSRKARGVVDQMEKAGVAFVNKVGDAAGAASLGRRAARAADAAAPGPDPALIRAQVTEIVEDMLRPLVRETDQAPPARVAEAAQPG